MDTNTNNDNSILQIPIEDIIPNRNQPRLNFDDASLSDLAESIKQHGIIQPLVLRRNESKYEIIAGERRYRAAKMAGLVSVPAIISNLTDSESREVAIIENIQRKPLSAIEEAKSYKSMLDNEHISQEEMAYKLGISQSAISNKLRLLTLDEEVQNDLLEGKISERHARSLLKLKEKEDQKNMVKRVIEERLTVKQLDNEIKKLIGNIPLVSNEVNIEKITSESEDLKIDNVQNQKPEQLEKVEEPELIEEEGEKMEEQGKSKFFNFEDIAVNMDVAEEEENKPQEFVTEKPVETEVNPFTSPVEPTETKEETPSEDVEFLDEFSTPDQSEKKDYSKIKDKINLILDNENYKIEEEDVDNKHIIKIIFEEN